MNIEDNGPVISPEILRAMREAAVRGTTVRELTEIIRSGMGFQATPTIPVLAGFVHAFYLPLPKTLPIREWIGSDRDEEIDALILPEIEKTKDKWLQPA